VDDEEPGFCTGDGFDPTLRHSAAAPEPRIGALENPPMRDDFKALRVVGALDDPYRSAPGFLQSVPQLGSGITATSENMAQQRIGGRDGFQQIGRTVRVLNIGTIRGESDQQPKGVSDYMTFVTFDPLSVVIPPNPATFGGFDALAVDDPRRRLGFATLTQTRGSSHPAGHHYAKRRNSAAPLKPAGCRWATCANGTLSSRCRGSHRTHRADQLSGAGRLSGPQPSAGPIEPIPRRLHHLRISFRCAHIDCA